MPVKPTIGQDPWGVTLNAHLETSLNLDGTLKDAAINTAATTINTNMALGIEWGNVRRYGARGDIVQDETSYIQAAIDAAYNRFASGQPYGGIVFFPPGVYASGPLLLRDGVILYGGGRIGGQGQVFGPVRLIPVTSGVNELGTGKWQISQANPAVSIGNAGIVGISMQGRGSFNHSGGLYFPNSQDLIISSVYANDYGMQALVVGGQLAKVTDSFFQGLISPSFVAALTSRSGASLLSGVDHQFLHNEFTGGGYLTVSSANLYSATVSSTCSHSLFDGNVFQTGDIGYYVNGAQNRHVGCRFDVNGGHGVAGGPDGFYNTFTGCQWNANSFATTNTYDHIHMIDGLAAQNHFHQPHFNSGGTTVRYCIYDALSNPNFANTYYDPTGETGGTGFYNLSESRVLITPGGLRVLAGATPSVLNQTTYVAVNGAPTTVTNLLGGVKGQRVTIIGFDAGKTTIQHNANIILTGGVNNTLADNEAITLLRSVSNWVQI